MTIIKSVTIILLTCALSFAFKVSQAEPLATGTLLSIETGVVSAEFPQACQSGSCIAFYQPDRWVCGYHCKQAPMAALLLVKINSLAARTFYWTIPI